MSSNKDLRRAKHAAYEKKQAAQGEKIIRYIGSACYPIRHLFCDDSIN